MPTFEQRTTDRIDLKRHPFWANLDQRPVTWIDDWEQRTDFEPEKIVWYRFVPIDVFTDPLVDAARSLILIDLDSWPASVIAHEGNLEHFAPSIEPHDSSATSAPSRGCSATMLHPARTVA